MKLAIVGGGPSAFYLTQQLLKQTKISSVCLFEKRLVPYGLVRYGVAPDHPEVKNVTTKFESIAQNERFQFVGNANIGKDVCLNQLREAFDGVVLSHGSQDEHRLGIPGEDLKNVFTANQFVGWYNGDPEAANLNPDLNGETAVIIGQGNVALDCARMLLAPTEDLSVTDITNHSLQALQKSKIKRVVVVGRRGVVQASFTSKEIRELLSIPSVSLEDNQVMKTQIDDCKQFLSTNRQKKRLMDILRKGNNHPNASKSLSFEFLASPKEIHQVDGKVSAIQLERNRLEGSLENPLKMKAIKTGDTFDIPASLVVTSIGYKNVALPGLSLKNGIIPNQEGRVLDKDGNVMPGLYASGWIKTGSVGVLTATLYDAAETGRSIEKDIQDGVLKDQNKPGLRKEAHQYGWTTFQDWLKINQHELEQGQKLGKPREKVVDIIKMKDLISK